MRLLDKLTERLRQRNTQLHEAARAATLIASVAESDGGKALMDWLRERERELARDYDQTRDYDGVCRIQGQRMEARRLLLFLEGAEKRAANLQKMEQSWTRKVSRLTRVS